MNNLLSLSGTKNYEIYRDAYCNYTEANLLLNI